MRKPHLRTRLRALCHLIHRPNPDPLRWLNDAPRPPPIAIHERISDASSTTFIELTVEEQAPSTDAPRLSTLSQDRTCLICLDDMPCGATCLRLPCKHAVWHTACVLTWLRGVSRCPLCNAQVSGKGLCYRGTFEREEWGLRERRVAEWLQPVGRRESRGREEFGLVGMLLGRRDLSWRLDERRLSLAGRPGRSNGTENGDGRQGRPPAANRSFIRSLTSTPRW